ncbi:MAG: cytochrome c1, partial [Gammaproteobacteria bacterium]|nr:cytochrome c1 [Gammaproteobacteria bacterium]
SMPHVLWELQGLQSAEFRTSEDPNTGETVNHFGDPAYFEAFTQETEGTMSAAEYDQFVRDLVNFLDWAGTPEQLERRTLGIWVLIFLLVFLIFAYLLKVEIWKDVK